jgi:hypothetical protein
VALIVLAAMAAAVPWLTARFGFVAFVAGYTVTVLAWLALRRARVPLHLAVAAGIGLRLLFLFATPQLSGDVWRYLFDGRTLASGVNPYTVLPDDPRVNHPELPTIYPPHAELLFAVAHHLTLWRLLLLACDVAMLLLLREHAFALATFPPLLFEGAWSGHVEIAAALLLLLAWQRRSGAAFAGAVGMKVIPIAALPALLLRSTKRWRFLGAFTLVLLVPIIPFLMTGPLMPGMRDYATRWIFNSPAYDALFFVFDRLGIAPHLKDAFTAIKDPLHLEPVAHFVYFHLYADYLTRAALGCIALLLIARWRRDPVASISALLLCSPAIHPWYWLVTVPLAIDRRWLWLALCAPASYLLYASVPKVVVYALCYGVPAVVTGLMARKERSSAA